jgi:hypothetical protein
MTRVLSILFALAALLLLASAGLLNWGIFGVPPSTIRWVTQSEEEVFGYDVYRGESEVGPFQRLNELAISGGGTTDLPQRYVYTDDTIESGKVYWYYVEKITLSGERSRLTPIYPSRPKAAFFW